MASGDVSRRRRKRDWRALCKVEGGGDPTSSKIDGSRDSPLPPMPHRIPPSKNWSSSLPKSCLNVPTPNGTRCPWLSSAALSEIPALGDPIRVLPQDTLGYTPPREHPAGIADSFQPELMRNFSPSRAVFHILVFSLILGNCEGHFEGSLG